MFHEFYDSVWQHPVLLFVAAIVGGAVAWQRRAQRHPSVARAVIALVVLELVDAWLTTTHVPGLGALQGVAATAIPVAFVILGDLRYLLAAEALRPDGSVEVTGSGFARALAWSFVVPAASQVAVRVILNASGPRALFLTYEVLFFALILARRPYVRGRLSDPVARRWHQALDRLALAWYGSWILADVLILGLPGDASDMGYLVRVVPNALYYGAMPAVLAIAAPTAPATAVDQGEIAPA